MRGDALEVSTCYQVQQAVDEQVAFEDGFPIELVKGVFLGLGIVCGFFRLLFCYLWRIDA